MWDSLHKLQAHLTAACEVHPAQPKVATTAGSRSGEGIAAGNTAYQKLSVTKSENEHVTVELQIQAVACGTSTFTALALAN
jgi:hypothetical protein